MTNMHMKRCSKSLTIREMQLKDMMRCHYMTIRMAKIKNTKNVEQPALFY